MKKKQHLIQMFDTSRPDCIEAPLGKVLASMNILRAMRKIQLKRSAVKATASFGRHFYILCLILERLKEGYDKLVKVYERKNLKEATGDNYYLLLLDLEIFFIYLRILMDDVASITPSFFGKETGKIPYKSFHRLKTWFIDKGKSLDPVFSKYLRDKTNWFDESKSERENVVHRMAGNIIFFSETDGATELKFQDIWDINNKKNRPKLKPLLNTVKKYVKNFYSFCRFYDKHFIEKMKIYGPATKSYSQGRHICYFKWFLDKLPNGFDFNQIS